MKIGKLDLPSWIKLDQLTMATNDISWQSLMKTISFRIKVLYNSEVLKPLQWKFLDRRFLQMALVSHVAHVFGRKQTNLRLFVGLKILTWWDIFGCFVALPMITFLIKLLNQIPFNPARFFSNLPERQRLCIADYGDDLHRLNFWKSRSEG